MRRRRPIARALAGSVVCLLTWIAAPSVAQATVSVSDARVTEGDGPTTMTFTVTRSPGLLGGPSITLSYLTSDGSARSPSDYIAAQGTVTFPRGDLLGTAQFQTITVTIAGDTLREPTESFTLTLTGPEIVQGTGVGIGTIFDNDPLFPAPPGRSPNTGGVDQKVISLAADRGEPNAPVFDPTISGDARIARYVAYSSAATNITAGTDGQHRNVFLVKRGGSPGKLGTPWEYGSTKLATPGRGGAAANGDSFAPVLGGWTRGDTAKKPRCVGFVSRASNIVAGDGNARADAFVRSLPSGKPRLIKMPAEVSEIAVSGDCRTIAAVAGGSLYAKRSGKRRRKLAGGAVSSPSLTFNGLQVTYSRNGKVLVRRAAGGTKTTIAAGSNSSADGDGPKGKIRRVAYERGNATYIKGLGAGEKLMTSGSSLPVMSGGASQAMFAFGPYAYLYAVSNSFGKAAPQGDCPEGRGVIDGLDLSARGNYAVLSCTDGPVYLAFLGGK